MPSLAEEPLQTIMATEATSQVGRHAFDAPHRFASTVLLNREPYENHPHKNQMLVARPQLATI